MDKKELLKRVGFSDEYIKYLDDFEKKDFYEIKSNLFLNEPFNYYTNDTSELYINTTLKNSSNELKIK